jgi:hypothetical protein
VGRRLAPAVLHGGYFGLGSGTRRVNTPGGETEERPALLQGKWKR